MTEKEAQLISILGAFILLSEEKTRQSKEEWKWYIFKYQLSELLKDLQILNCMVQKYRSNRTKQ